MSRTARLVFTLPLPLSGISCITQSMDARDSGRQVSLDFSGDQPLRAVLAEAFDALTRLDLDADTQARAAVIVEELLANLFDHGGLGPAGVIRLEFDRGADSLRLQL